MLVSITDRSAQIIVRADSLRNKFHIKLSILSSYSMLTPGPTSSSTDPIAPGARQGSHWSTNFQVTGMTGSGNRSALNTGTEPRSAVVEMDALPLGQRWGE